MKAARKTAAPTQASRRQTAAEPPSSAPVSAPVFPPALPPGLAAALAYLPRWLAHQMRLTEQPGLSVAVAHQGRVVAEFALGMADATMPLTPRHRFRVASHSKTFTAAAVLLLREHGCWRLDDAVGDFVPGLHPQVAAATLAQLLSHSAGLVRDGGDAGQWSDRRPFLNEAELRADLARGPVLPPNTRFKYSNHGYGLLGLAIAAVTGEPYAQWVAREIVAASGLRETTPDAPTSLLAEGTRFARGHSAKWPLGRRVHIPGDNPTHALAAATGFVSTAADLVRFFASLAPDAATSVLGADSRRELVRRQWRDPYGTVERWYGLGTLSGGTAGAGPEWDHFGHTGGFQGTLSRTVHVPAQALTISMLTNAADGLAGVWVDGALQLLRSALQHGAPGKRTAAWQGRWWGLWGAMDLLPGTDKVLVANPALLNPVLDAPQIEPGPSTDEGRIVLAGGFASHGEGARLERDARGRVQALWLGGTRLQSEARAAQELTRRYDRPGG